MVCSPYSVAVALAMTRVGAEARTATEMTDVLHAGPSWDSGLNWLDQQLVSRTGRRERGDGSRATVSLETANSLWGQRDEHWRRPFLDTLAEQYGAGMHVVDYAHDAEAARRTINAWTADRTHDRILELVARHVLDEMTRLVLVNAIWFKAPWEKPFDKHSTEQRAFTRRDSSRVDVSMMSNTFEGGDFASGPGWRPARLPYAGRDLAMAVVVPEEGHTVTEVEQSLAGAGLGRLLGGFGHVDLLDVRLPRWKTRTATSLRPMLQALGMPTAFTDAADFSAMTDTEPLKIGAVEHQAWIGVDEDGTEAAAATAVEMRATSARVPANPQAVHADRPFVYVIHDVATATPLFIGRVDDPSKR